MSNKSMRLNPLSWEYGGWRRFFAVSAAWNFLGAVPALIKPGLNLLALYGLSTNDYYMLFLNRSFWLAVLIFGIGYLIVAYDPARFPGIIIMGIIGKTAVAISWFYLFSVDRATGFAALAAVGDSLFTLLFILYLIAGPKSANNRQSLIDNDN